MSELIQNTNYDANLALLLAQFQSSPKLKAVLSAANAQANDLELALFELRDWFWLTTAEGQQLDVIGEILQVARNGRTDADYRMDILARIGLSISGEPEGIIRVLRTLYGATSVEIIPAYPAVRAAFYLTTDIELFQAELDRFTGAGIQGFLASSIIDGLDNFLVDAVGRYIVGVKDVHNYSLRLSGDRETLLVDYSGDNFIVRI